jgi:hypothetical protein
MSEETITILKSAYKQLVDDSKFLDALRACGVDNWEGYSEACQMVQEEAG